MFVSRSLLSVLCPLLQLFGDVFGNMGGGRGGRRRGPARARVEVGVELTLKEAALGCTKTLSFSVPTRCKDCGTGACLFASAEGNWTLHPSHFARHLFVLIITSLPATHANDVGLCL